MAHHIRKQNRAITFTVPATADEFAPEVLYCGPTNNASNLDGVLDTCLVGRDMPADAAIVVEVLTPGADPSDDANWVSDGIPWGVGSEAGGSNYAGLRVRVRVKSGGTAGDGTVLMGWTA
jgi:hypothetical protein